MQVRSSRIWIPRNGSIRRTCIRPRAESTVHCRSIVYHIPLAAHATGRHRPKGNVGATRLLDGGRQQVPPRLRTRSRPTGQGERITESSPRQATRCAWRSHRSDDTSASSFHGSLAIEKRRKGPHVEEIEANVRIERRPIDRRRYRPPSLRAPSKARGGGPVGLRKVVDGKILPAARFSRASS